MSVDLCTEMNRWPTGSDTDLLGEDLFPDGYDEAHGGPGEDPDRFYLSVNEIPSHDQGCDDWYNELDDEHDPLEGSLNLA
jgi:hypothetical protein